VTVRVLWGSLLATGLAAGLIATLSACSSGSPDAGDPTVAPTPSETAELPSPTPSAEAPGVLTVPVDCTELLPESEQRELAAEGLTLLGGPGSRFGTGYSPDRTPEELLGGISCVWDREDAGVGEGVNQSSIMLSVAPLSTDTYQQTVDELTQQGLNFSETDDVAFYAVLGDESGFPLQLNALRDDSWISVVSARGGQDAYDRSTVLADAIAANVYG